MNRRAFLASLGAAAAAPVAPAAQLVPVVGPPIATPPIQCMPIPRSEVRLYAHTYVPLQRVGRPWGPVTIFLTYQPEAS